MQEILECFLKDEDVDMQRQVQFIIKQLNLGIKHRLTNSWTKMSKYFCHDQWQLLIAFQVPKILRLITMLIPTTKMMILMRYCKVVLIFSRGILVDSIVLFSVL